MIPQGSPLPNDPVVTVARPPLLDMLSLALAVLAVGVGVIIASRMPGAVETAAAYDRARPCVIPGLVWVPPPDCYMLVTGQITDSRRSGRGFTSEYELGLRLQTGPRSVRFPGPLIGAPTLYMHAPVGAKVWRDTVTLINVAGWDFETEDNPLRQERELALSGFGPLTTGLALLALAAWAGRGSGSGEDVARMLAAAAGSMATLLSVQGSPGGRVVLRPSRGPGTYRGRRPRQTLAWWRPVLMTAAALTVIGPRALISPLQIRGTALWSAALGGAGVAALVVSLGLTELRLVRLRLFADEAEFGTTNGMGLSRRYPHSELDRIAIASLGDDDVSPGSERSEVRFIGPSGRVLFKAPGDLWARDDLRAFAAFLGKPVEGF